jgi:serine/threonine protein kinase
MGEVFRAEHQYAGRVVALKLLRKDFATDPDLTRRFFQEAQAVNKIRHPNIVDVLDAGLCEEGPYVAMEILEGSSLSGALARVGRFDLTAALAVILPMLNALDAAHRQSIVHRDLKPENVFLQKTQGGVTVKLLDFGIAKVLGSSTNTNTGVVFGTPDYLSPEQASGEGVIDGRSDLFAVGIVLFELLTGRRPFEAQSAVATAYKIVHAPAPRLASLGVVVDDRVQAVLDVALAKSQDDRFLGAQSFADMLAPLAPDGATRRASLLGLVDAVTGLEPTMAVPPVAETGDPRDAGALDVPAFDDEARAASTPAAPPSPPKPPKPAQPAAPTLASRAEDVRLYTNVAAEHRELTSTPAIREPVVTPAIREPVVTPAYRDPAVTPAYRDPAVTPRAREPLATPLFRDSAPDPARRSSPTFSTTPPVGTPKRLSPVPPAGTRTPTARRTAWMPRPLPSHVRGKCHTRGSVPRAVNRWIERAFGAPARDDVLRVIPTELAESYRADGFNALVWYDIEALDTFLEAATALVFGGDVAAWRGLARENFDRDLGPIFRSTVARAGDPVSLLKRSVTAWSRLYDFANVRISEPSSSSGGTMSRASIRFDGFDAASLALRNVTIGTAEGLLKSAADHDVTSRVMAGEASFARDFEFELAWPAKR